jgi:arginyl-tRNA synthetase
MAAEITDIVRHGLMAARQSGALAYDAEPPVILETPKQAAHGDVACPVALALARTARRPPREVAQAIIDHMELPETLVQRVEIAGPGYINFHLAPAYWTGRLAAAVAEGDGFGQSDWAKGGKVLVEFVSANPTGPLHVGHGRGAVVGDAIARLLAACGAEVAREYYINDVGNQMNVLGRSTYVRYQQAAGRDAELPADHYQGDYIREIAEALRKEDGDAWLDKPEEEWLPRFARAAAEAMLFGRPGVMQGIREELADFRITFDRWYSEKELYTGAPNAVDRALATLADAGLVYEEEGARWLATSGHGDDKDRVLVRANGVTTYFASDVAYHKEKFDRGFDRLIDVWGADHHGYVGRMKAAVAMLGHEPKDLEIVLVQLVSLLKGGQPVAMSTRAGEFVTLKEVVDEIGVDATRFYFLTRKADAHLEFDLEVAKSKTADNPVYYVQYGHARVHQLFAKAAEAGLGTMAEDGSCDLGDTVDLTPIEDPESLALARQVASYPQVVEGAGRELAVHRIPYFLQELAGSFHAYYYKHRFVGEDAALSRARLLLAAAVGQVLKNGLALLGVSAPVRM